MPLLRDQSDVSAVVPMPTDNIGQSSSINIVSGETVVWYYVHTAVWTAAATQAAGTLVTAKLSNNRLLNSISSALGSYNDSSFSLGATTRFDTRVACPESVLAKIAFMSPTDQMVELAPFLATKGYYVVDHRRGQLWGNSKASVANDSASYTNFAASTSGTVSENLGQVGGVSVVSGVTTPSTITAGEQNVLVDAVYNATPTARTEGQRGNLQADINGNILVSLGTKIAGEDLTNDVMKVEQQMTYTPIVLAAPTTTTVKSGAGFLHALVINTPAATGVITIYDNTAASGTKIATITQPAALLDGVGKTILYNVKFATGLTIVTATAAQDLTVAWR